MRLISTLSVFAATIIFLATPVVGGTISLAWDPVSNANLTDYRVYWGVAPGSYDQYRDVSRDTTATLADLDDCTMYYVGVKSQDAAGNQSAGFLSEISGYPRPRVAEVTPTSVEPGLDISIVIRGANFMTGATVRFGDPRITVNSVTVGSCSELTASVRVGCDATSGTTTITVANPDRSSGTSAAILAVGGALAP